MTEVYELQNRPLDELIRRCRNGLEDRAVGGEELSELIRRAIEDRNDAAWDALVGLLRPQILSWLYSVEPQREDRSALDVAPSNAEYLVYRALQHFRQLIKANYLHHQFPNTRAALTLLRRSIEAVLEG